MSSKIIAAGVALLSFISVGYFSCTKPGVITPQCNGIACLNGAHCDTLLKCVCPVGYEGVNCGTASVSRYIGAWDATETISGSDSAYYDGRTSTYVAFLKNTATKTTFFIDQFRGNANYNNLVCVLDTGNTSSFVIDTNSNFHMWYDHVVLLSGSGGIAADNSAITGRYIVYYINHTGNYQRDTVSFTLTPHHL